MAIYSPVLQSLDIIPNIQFCYDEIYFPFIAVWYSDRQHKSFYQLFTNRRHACEFLQILVSKDKSVALYEWDEDSSYYASINL